MATILVLVHTHDRFRERAFMVQGLFEHWVGMGHRVIVHQGVTGLPRADVAMLHVDLSVVPEPYREALRPYPVVINGGAVDIRKRRFSQQIVAPGDGYEGPVILKTDLNAGGIPEWNHLRLDIERGLRPARPARIMPGRYPIFASPSAVPKSAWSDPDLVVERFCPERDERGYYMRTWVFFGDRERCNRVLGPHPVVKAEDVIERVPVPIPDELRLVRARLGFDYGKFDFAFHEGKPVLFDVNRTPAMAPNLLEALKAGMADLSKGITAFLGR
ncbi:MAG: hypothetical protein U0359_29100 [Byssovorax sp.]